MTLLLLLTSTATSFTVDTVAIVQRIQRNTSATIDLQITSEGVPVDPDPASAVVTVTRDDGTTIVDHVTADQSGTGHFTHTIPAALTGQLDWLTATWDVTINGQVQHTSTRIEIVGGFLFGIGNARQDPDLKDTTTYPTARLVDARTYAEQELEKAIGAAFVPRYQRRRVNGTGTKMLPVAGASPIRAIRSITETTTAYTYTTDDLAAVQTGNGFLFSSRTWTSGLGNINVAYEHGYDYPPAAVSQAALTLAKDYLVRGPMDDRAIQRATEDGPIFIATPGWHGNRFGIPSVDAVIDMYRTPTLA